MCKHCASVRILRYKDSAFFRIITLLGKKMNKKTSICLLLSLALGGLKMSVRISQVRQNFISSAAYSYHKCEKMLPQVPQSGAYMSLIYALHSLIGGCSSENIEIVCVFARLALFLQSI